MTGTWTFRLAATVLLAGALVQPAAALTLDIRFDGRPAPRDDHRPVRISLTVRDDDGTPSHGLLLHHEKKMHLVAISGDLVDMAHIHPIEVQPGRFHLDLRSRAGRDTDNEQALSALNRAGNWSLFAEVSDAPGESVLLESSVRVPGRNRVRPLPAPMTWQGRFCRTAVPRLGTGAVAEWERVVRSDGSTALVCRLLDGRGEELAGFTPWLGMTAHGVLAGKTSSGVAFRHLHPEGGMVHDMSGMAGMDHSGHDMSGMAGMDHSGHAVTDQGSPARWTFVLPTDEPLPSGVYRFWLQARRDGKVLTLPFTLRL